MRGWELTSGVRVDSGASWYWGELTRNPFMCVLFHFSIVKYDLPFFVVESYCVLLYWFYKYILLFANFLCIHVKDIFTMYPLKVYIV